jgi:hypothetical protein
MPKANVNTDEYQETDGMGTEGGGCEKASRGGCEKASRGGCEKASRGGCEKASTTNQIHTEPDTYRTTIPPIPLSGGRERIALLPDIQPQPEKSLSQKADIILKQYNEVATRCGFPTKRKLNQKQLDQVSSRLRSFSLPSQWREMFERLAKSEYFKGESWFGLEYIIRNDDNFEKVRCGAFDWKRKKQPANFLPASTAKPINWKED